MVFNRFLSRMGSIFLRHTAPAIKRTQAELGGKAPVIVLMTLIRCGGAGASDLVSIMPDRIVLVACRIYAQRGIYDALVEKLGNAVSSLKWAPEDKSTELGPLSSLAHLKRVTAAVEE